MQVLMITSGGPGSGKSRIIKAFLWFAFQHGLSQTIGVVSFAWRAALNLSCASNVGEL